MLYVIFIFAVFWTILFSADPDRINARKYHGQELFTILAEEEQNNKIKIYLRGIYSLLYAFFYYTSIIIGIPLIIIWALSNDIGLQILAVLAAIAVLIMVGSLALWFNRLLSGQKGTAEIQTEGGQRYKGELLSEKRIVEVDIKVRDMIEDSHVKGILIDETDERIRICTPGGNYSANKSSSNLIKIDKKTIINGKIRLKDGTVKYGRRIYFLGQDPVKDILASLPDFYLVIYLWHLFIVLLVHNL